MISGVFVIAALSVFGARRTDAQTPPPAPKPATSGSDAPPDESLLGEVPVNGSAGTIPLPKMAVVPIAATTDADGTVQSVVRRDLDLCGQYDMIPMDVVPDGSGDFTHDTPVDPKGWKAKGADFLVRVFANASAGGDVELTGEAWLVNKPLTKAAFTKVMTAKKGDVRVTAHKMTDAILGALTGRPGPFASHLAYTARSGKMVQGLIARRVFLVESDGANGAPYSPEGDTALSPAMGPQGEWYYALSHDFSPFHIVHGPKATPFALSTTGSVLGLTFSRDRQKLAVAVMDQGFEDIYVGPADGSDPRPMIAPPLANHPTIGPMGKVAYVAGSDVPRVYVDKKPISPAGFHASAPTFCDTPKGLLVIFNVGVGANADLVATDVGGGGLMRLTQNQGANLTPACSPDGRLVAYFSTRKTGDGPGLYIMPVASPWKAKRISKEMGESLAWEMDP
jgi:TolB protein